MTGQVKLSINFHVMLIALLSPQQVFLWRSEENYLNLRNWHQIKQFCFWRRILIDCLEVEESQSCSRPCSWEILCETTATWQVTGKPDIHTAGFYIDIFSPLDIGFHLLLSDPLIIIRYPCYLFLCLCRVTPLVCWTYLGLRTSTGTVLNSSVSTMPMNTFSIISTNISSSLNRYELY